jgi:hypothetical protein
VRSAPRSATQETGGVVTGRRGIPPICGASCSVHVGGFCHDAGAQQRRPDFVVIWGDDSGPRMNTWPGGGMTPFRTEKK